MLKLNIKIHENISVPCKLLITVTSSEDNMGYDVICKSLFVLSRKRASLHLHLLNNPLLPTDLKCNNNMFTEYLKIFFIYLAVHILWYAGSSFLMRD